MADDLALRQKAGENVEKRLLNFLLGFMPAGNLKLNDVKEIADVARALAFDEFSKAGQP